MSSLALLEPDNSVLNNLNDAPIVDAKVAGHSDTPHGIIKNSQNLPKSLERQLQGAGTSNTFIAGNTAGKIPSKIIMGPNAGTAQIASAL